MKRIIFILDRRMNSVAALASGLALAGAATLAAYQVVARFVLFEPSSWTEPITRLLLIWMVYLASATLFRQGAMISMRMLEGFLADRKLLVLQAFGAAASVIFLGVLLWYGIDLAYRVRHQIIGGLGISIAWGYAAIPVGAVFSILAILARYFEMIEAGDDSSSSGNG